MRQIMLGSVVALALLATGGVLADPYWGDVDQPWFGAVRPDGLGVVCHTQDAYPGYYCALVVPRPLRGFSASQEAGIVARRLMDLNPEQRPLRPEQIRLGSVGGRTALYVDQVEGQRWLLTTVDAAWARQQRLDTATLARWWRDRLRYLVAQSAPGQRLGRGYHLTAADQAALADPLAVLKIPRGYARRSPLDPALSRNARLVALPNNLPLDPNVRRLP